MKHFFRFAALLLFVIPRLSFGQDTAKLFKNTFLEVKTELNRRNDVLLFLANKLTETGVIKKDEISKFKTVVIDFYSALDSLNKIDSLAMASINVKDNSVIHSYWKIIAITDDKLSMKSKKEISPLIAQYEASENRIYQRRKEYNDLCKSYNSPDLMFRTNPIDADVIKDF